MILSSRALNLSDRYNRFQARTESCQSEPYRNYQQNSSSHWLTGRFQKDKSSRVQQITEPEPYQHEPPLSAGPASMNVEPVRHYDKYKTPIVLQWENINVGGVKKSMVTVM
jgi:hypothetical protein